MEVMKNISILEQKLKKLMIIRHQEILGRGPEEVWFKIHRNVITFYCSKSLTQLENFLLNTPDGESQVKKIRQTIANHVKSQISSYFEVQDGLKILGMTVDFSIHSNTFFGAILFEENSEDISED